MRIIIGILALIGLLPLSLGYDEIELDRLIELDLWSTKDGKLFYVQVEIGEGDNRQPFNLLISNWFYYSTWILSNSVSQTRGYGNNTTYLAEESHNKIHVMNQIPYKADIHLDTWHLGSLRLPDQQFMVLSPVSFYDGSPLRPGLDGMVAIRANVGSKGKTMDNLFGVLRKRGLVKDSLISLYFNSTNQVDVIQQHPVGKLIFGGLDERYYTGPITYVPINREMGCMPMSKVRLDWSSSNRTRVDTSVIKVAEKGWVDLDSGWLRLDTTTVHYAGPKGSLDRIHLNFLGAKLIMSGEIYAFDDCDRDNKPDVVFSLADGIFNVTVTANDYVIRTKINGRHVCISAFKPIDNYMWFFGTQFLRKQYTVFGEGKTGFARPI